jgi:hypothetical protein
MLGHGKITFETPNVVDPGDQPPSRPSRRERKKYLDNPDVVVRERPNYTDREDHRKRFKPPLTRTIKLDYRMAGDDEPNPESGLVDLAVEDPESGSNFQQLDLQDLSNENHSPQTPVSPGMENARLFAATMLAETERRQSQRNIMFEDSDSTRSTRSVPMRWPRRGRRSEFGGLRPKFASRDEDSSEGLFKVQQQVQRRRLCLRVMIVLVALCLVLCFSILGHQAIKSNHKGSGASSLSDDSTRLSLAMDSLADHGISQRALLEDPSSVQYRAAHWIAVEDLERVHIPVNLDENSFQFVQRYVLAVLYFALNGSKWNNPLNFVSDLHECSWYKTIPNDSGELLAVGVSCDDRLQVRNLVIRKCCCTRNSETETWAPSSYVSMSYPVL